MKIVFVCEYYLPHIGGVETVFNHLALKLAENGNNVHIITCQLENTPNFEIIDGITIHRVKVPQKGDRYWFTFLAIPSVFKVAKDAAVIHTTTYTGAFPAWLTAKILNKRCVITVHEVWGTLWYKLSGMNWLSSSTHRYLEKLIISLPFDKYCCVSNYTKDCLLSEGIGINKNKCVTIYNGIDYNLFNPLTAGGNKIRDKLSIGNDFIYLYFGRPGISKGLEYLINAVPMVSETIPDSRLLLILAHDPQKGYDKIQYLIKQLNIENNIILLDPVSRNELPDYIMASDCVVVPSISEGFGFSAAEACAMGKPVIVTNVASLPEVISGEHIFIEPKNPQAIADGVEKVYNRKVEYLSKKVFIWDDCCQKYLDIYKKLL
jgi:glycosyltransferase involved in cell wall biosynthesis